MNKANYIVHTDGGSRGNPGPAAIGYAITDANGTLLKEHGEYIGETTNNDAEYQAVIFALKKLKALAGKDNISSAIIDVYVDSELLQKQMTGEYKIKDETVAQHFVAIHNLQIDFGDVRFHHVRREHNKDADRMVNAALDKQENALL